MFEAKNLSILNPILSKKWKNILFETETAHSVMRMKRVRMIKMVRRRRRMIIIIRRSSSSHLAVFVGSLCNRWPFTTTTCWTTAPSGTHRSSFELSGAILEVLTWSFRDRLIVHSILQLSHCGVWIDHNYNFIKASNAAQQISLNLSECMYLLVLILICMFMMFIFVCS